jgi:hypothetical protein
MSSNDSPQDPTPHKPLRSFRKKSIQSLLATSEKKRKRGKYLVIFVIVLMVGLSALMLIANCALHNYSEIIPSLFYLLVNIVVTILLFQGSFIARLIAAAWCGLMLIMYLYAAILIGYNSFHDQTILFVTIIICMIGYGIPTYLLAFSSSVMTFIDQQNQKR